MKTIISIILSVALAVVHTPVLNAAEVKQGVTPKSITTIKFMSESLGQERTVNVLLPPDYETSTRRYPVLYLLHGLGDNHSAWAYMTNLSGYAAHHSIIIVMPDASRSWYVNSAADPKARFEDFIAKDLITYTDSHFRTIPLPRARAIAGLSMGGYGAAFLGLKHYRTFTALGSFSGAVGKPHDPPPPPSADANQEKQDKEIQSVFGAAGSQDRADRDPFALLDKVPPAQMPLIYIACGGQDVLVKQNRAFVELLAEKKIPYEYREISPRTHSWDFWDDQIRIFLDILDQLPGFAQHQ
jgi:putative tributyrin esterase